MLSLEARDGRPRWSRPLRTERLTAPLVAPDGVTWVGAADGLHAVSPLGEELWLARIGAIRDAPALGRDGGAVVVAGTTLYAVRRDGTVRWRHDLDAPAAAAAVVDVAGNAFVTTADRRVVAVRDGGEQAERLWELALDDEPRGSPVVGAMGALYVSTAGGVVLELGAPAAGLGALLPPRACACAAARCGRVLDACGAEPGCAAIVQCAARRGCRGAACRLPDACADTIDLYGGFFSQSSALAAGLDECVVRECGGCR